MSFRLIPQQILSSQSLGFSAVAIVSGLQIAWADRAESLLIRAQKTGGTANIKVQYAFSIRGTAINGSFTAPQSALVTATQTDFAASAKRWNAIALPNILAPYVAFRFLGVTPNPHTGVTVDAYFVRRESF